MIKIIDIYAQSLVNTDVKAVYPRTARALDALNARLDPVLAAHRELGEGKTT